MNGENAQHSDYLTVFFLAPVLRQNELEEATGEQQTTRVRQDEKPEENRIKRFKIHSVRTLRNDTQNKARQIHARPKKKYECHSSHWFVPHNSDVLPKRRWRL